MGTQWIEIVTDYAMVLIDDTRLTDDAAADPAQFFRRMSLYINLAIPLLNRPPELQSYLSNELRQPQYTDAEWISTEESLTAETAVSTGNVGYGLFSCAVRQTDAAGNISLTRYDAAAYDSETGVVTFPIQAAENTEYIMDFYNDGEFKNELTATQKRLLGIATAYVWDERFSRNWLNMQMKIHDQSFTTVNESTYTEKITARLKTNKKLLSDELWKYEQDCNYNAYVTGDKLRKLV